MSYDKYLKRAVDSGAREAKVIDADQVVTANWVRLKCQYGCGAYGTRLTCPPYSPPPEYTQEVLKEYSRGMLLVYRTKPEDEGKTEGTIGNTVAELEREMFLDGYYKAYGMGAGPCSLCEKCDLSRPCIHPRRARPSMEASGIDVYQTARNAGFGIDVVKSYDQPCTYCSLILIE